MSKQYEDLEPGDFLLYQGKPAMRGTALRGYCVITGDPPQMLFDVDPKQITLTDHMTIAELRTAPGGATVQVAENAIWTKVIIGRGHRWQSSGAAPLLWTSEEIAARGAKYIKVRGPVEVGDSIVVTARERTGGGNYSVKARLHDGTLVSGMLYL